MSATLEDHLRKRRDGGNKLLVPYITGGLGGDWLDNVRAADDAGADAIEIGIPFSDPVMDGPTIQTANDLALEQGVTPESVLSELHDVDVAAPLVVMTYYNIAYHAGLQRFAGTLFEAGVVGAILPDAPLEEIGEWSTVAGSHGVEAVLLAAPTADDERLARIAKASRGFVYGVGLVGITGVRAELASSARDIARRLRAVTDKPVIVGVGIGTPSQAGEAVEDSDGVVVGSAIVQAILDGKGPAGVGALVGSFRAAIDE
jgi:tryptophan synthase alpha chain